jgi:carbon monoxide dehydrogenase subunit G
MAIEQSVIASGNIPAPPERVWEMVSDTSRYAEWVENTLQVVRTDGPARVGSTYDEITRLVGPWKTSTRWRITEFVPIRLQVHEGAGVITARQMAVIIELAPAGENTHLTLTIRTTPRFGAIGSAIGRAMNSTLTRAQQRSVDAFAALVAREYPSS